MFTLTKHIQSIDSAERDRSALDILAEIFYKEKSLQEFFLGDRSDLVKLFDWNAVYEHFSPFIRQQVRLMERKPKHKR